MPFGCLYRRGSRSHRNPSTESETSRRRDLLPCRVILPVPYGTMCCGQRKPGPVDPVYRSQHVAGEISSHMTKPRKPLQSWHFLQECRFGVTLRVTNGTEQRSSLSDSDSDKSVIGSPLMRWRSLRWASGRGQRTLGRGQERRGAACVSTSRQILVWRNLTCGFRK